MGRGWGKYVKGEKGVKVSKLGPDEWLGVIKGDKGYSKM